jgi:hypothetical protein
MKTPFRFAHALCLLLFWYVYAIGQDLDLPSPAESLSGIDSVAIGTSPAAADPDLVGEVPASQQAESYSDSEEIFPGSQFPRTQWFMPTTWMMGPAWEKSFEVGINGSEGNAQALSLITSGRLKRETERSTWGVDVVYAKTEANDTMTQHYAFLNSRYDFKLGEGRWSLFHITRLEYDEFKAFDLRLAINGGLGYDFIRSDTRKLTGRFGAGTSREIGGLNEEWVPEAVLGADYEHKLSKRQKLSVTSDYYPSWEDFNDYRLVTQASWELLLDEDTNLSLKVGFLDRYDSTPMGLAANDVDYFITLLWKL